MMKAYFEGIEKKISNGIKVFEYDSLYFLRNQGGKGLWKFNEKGELIKEIMDGEYEKISYYKRYKLLYYDTQTISLIGVEYSFYIIDILNNNDEYIKNFINLFIGEPFSSELMKIVKLYKEKFGSSR